MMGEMKRLVLFLLFLFPLCLLAAGEENDYPQQIVRLAQMQDGTEYLQTPVARYTDERGNVVDLIGAVHLADPYYYRALNRAFARYDAVLYEMVDGEGLPERILLIRKVLSGKASPEECAKYEQMQEEEKTKGNLPGKLLSSYYLSAARSLRLVCQMEAVDYGRENFVYADMSMDELRAAMSAQGETWLTLLADSLSESSFLSGNPLICSTEEMRHELIHGLVRYSQSARMEQRSIIRARNIRCFEVLDRELARDSAPRRWAIFYGSYHLRDMHGRLLERGFSLKGVQWIKAIRGKKLGN